MSEYQYYEFQALDRPLTEDEQDELRELSSRATITARSFTNEYNYGDFRGKPEAVLARYFDAFLYVANWGTHRVAFRLPLEVLDTAAVEQYCNQDRVTIKLVPPFAVISMEYSSEEGWGWEDGGGYLGPLLPLRAELMAGDLRCLYLAWLANTTDFDDDEATTVIEPPVPPGLGRLTAAQQALAEFLHLEPDLLEAAQQGTAGEAAPEIGRADHARWLKRQPASRRDGWLLRLMGGDEGVRAEVLRAFLADSRSGRSPGAERPRRSLAKLRALGEEREQEALRAKAAEEAQERATRFENLARDEKKLWEAVELAIGSTKSSQYAAAIRWLKDLRDLAAHQGTTEEFDRKVKALRARNARRTSLLKLLEAAGF